MSFPIAAHFALRSLGIRTPTFDALWPKCYRQRTTIYTMLPVPRRGIEPRLPALQTGALPTELSWRKECFRYIHKPFVDQEGIEPSIQVCKTRVFPLALPAHLFVPRVGFAPTHPKDEIYSFVCLSNCTDAAMA